jgi:hypothetical protein
LELPKYYLDADGLLQQSLPPLNKGKDNLETIAKAPNITRHYAGKLAEWDVLQEDALRFYESTPTVTELKRCAHAPIYMDPAIERLNGRAMTLERLQAGAEITLSGRFFWNALAVVVHIVETLTTAQHGKSLYPDFLPAQLTYGDSWIIEKPFRVDGQQPDAVLKLPSGPGHKIRMVGELKFCVPKDFATMIEESKRCEGTKFRAILGMSSTTLVQTNTNSSKDN